MEKKYLVAYFSASGITKAVAGKLAAAVSADLFEIKPAVPYSKDDLDWMNKESRSSVEMNHPSSRPKLAESYLNLNEYDAVFLGFPIWWYVAPTIIQSFLESYDFSGMTVIPFGTSGGSGIEEAQERLEKTQKSTIKWKPGRMLNGNVTEDMLKEWVENLFGRSHS